MTPKSQAANSGLLKWTGKSHTAMDGLSNKVYVSTSSRSPKDGLNRVSVPKSDCSSVYPVKTSSPGLSIIDGTKKMSVNAADDKRDTTTAESNSFKDEVTITAKFNSNGNVTRTTATVESDLSPAAAKTLTTSPQSVVTTAYTTKTYTSKPKVSDAIVSRITSSQSRMAKLRQTSVTLAHKTSIINATEISTAQNGSKNLAFCSTEKAKETVKSDVGNGKNIADANPKAVSDSSNFVQRSVINKSDCSKSATPLYSRRLTSNVEVHACSEGISSSDSVLYSPVRVNSNNNGPVEDLRESPIMPHTRRERYATASCQRMFRTVDDERRLKEKRLRKQDNVCVSVSAPVKSSVSHDEYSLCVPGAQQENSKWTSAKQRLGQMPQQPQRWSIRNASFITSSSPCVSSAKKPSMPEQSTYPKSPFIKKSVTFSPSRITRVSFGDIESGGVETSSRSPLSDRYVTVTSSRSERESGTCARRRYRRSASSSSATVRSGPSCVASSSPIAGRVLRSPAASRLGRSVSDCGAVPSAAATNHESKSVDSAVVSAPAVDSDALSPAVDGPARDPDSATISSAALSPSSDHPASSLAVRSSLPARRASPRSSVSVTSDSAGQEYASSSSSCAASPALAQKTKWKDLAEMMRRIRKDPQRVSEAETARFCGAFGGKGDEGSSERLVKIVLSSVCYQLPLRSDLPVREEHLFDVSDLQHEPPLISKCGSLEVTFTYQAVRGKMTVHVHRAREIPTKDRGGANSTQVRIMLLPTKKQRFKTKVKEGEEPVFDETFVFSKIFTDEIPGLGVRFRLYGLERMRREYMIGESVIGFASLTLTEPSTHWVILEPRSNLSHGDSGFDVSSLSRSDSASSMQSVQSLQHGGMPELLVGLAYHGTTGRLAVQVVKGSNFRNMATNRPPDTYVKVTLMSPSGQEVQNCKTSIRRGQPNPLFKETFMLQVAQFQLPEVTLMVSVYNKKSMKKKEMIGWFSLGQNSSGEEEGSHWADMRESKGDEVCRWHVLLES